MMIAVLVLASVCLLANLIGIAVSLGLNIAMSRDLRDVLTLAKIQHGHVQGIERATVTIQTVLMSMLAERRSPGMGFPFHLPHMPMSMEEPDTSPPGSVGLREVFETEDGRHSAESFQELMEKVSNDPTYKVTKPEDIEKLKDLFRGQLPPTPEKPAGEIPPPPAPPSNRVIKETDTRTPLAHLEELDILDELNDEDEPKTNNEEDDDGA